LICLQNIIRQPEVFQSVHSRAVQANDLCDVSAPLHSSFSSRDGGAQNVAEFLATGNSRARIQHISIMRVVLELKCLMDTVYFFHHRGVCSSPGIYDIKPTGYHHSIQRSRWTQQNATENVSSNPDSDALLCLRL
jgi:hypothetical protein